MRLDKNAKFFRHLDLVKIRLEITPRNNCIEEKTSFDYKKKLF